MNNKTLYYILNLTWGLPMNILGGLVALALLSIGKRPKKHCGCLYFEIGKGWGGLSLGLIFLCGKNASKHTKNHEFGHSIQNAIFGWAMVGITLCSMTRYWYRRVRQWMKLGNKTAYDDIWFEGQATSLGNKYSIAS